MLRRRELTELKQPPQWRLTPKDWLVRPGECQGFFAPDQRAGRGKDWAPRKHSRGLRHPARTEHGIPHRRTQTRGFDRIRVAATLPAGHSFPNHHPQSQNQEETSYERIHAHCVN
jgi:hypothetical protein